MGALAAVDLQPEVVALVVSLLALLISATSFWHATAKPADLVVDLLSAETRGGGTHPVPGCYEVTLSLALSNAGARAGLLVSLDVVDVRASGAPEFATGAVPHRHHAYPSMPRTVEAGEVR